MIKYLKALEEKGVSIDSIIKEFLIDQYGSVYPNLEVEIKKVDEYDDCYYFYAFCGDSFLSTTISDFEYDLNGKYNSDLMCDYNRSRTGQVITLSTFNSDWINIVLTKIKEVSPELKGEYLKHLKNIYTYRKNKYEALCSNAIALEYESSIKIAKDKRNIAYSKLESSIKKTNGEILNIIKTEEKGSEEKE